MGNSKVIFEIVNGWLICGSRRIRLDTVQHYARSGDYVALCCGESFAQIDVRKECLSRGVDLVSENDVQTVAVDFMTALDKHFWAGARNEP